MEKLEISYRFSKTGELLEPMAGLAGIVPKPAMPALWKAVLLRLWLVFTVIACGASAVAHMMIGLNNDHLDLMDQVRRIFAGGTPYVAFADVNPPLIHLIYMVPLALSRLAGIPVDVALNSFTLGLACASLFVCARIMKTGGVTVATRQILLSAVALALSAVSFIHQPFGDRDHVMMVLVSPWLILYSPLCRRETIPARWRAIAAVMAGIGFALKPYFYVIYIASGCFGLFRGGRISALLRQWEQHVVVGMAVLYIATIYIFFPQYPATMLPLVWNTYGVMQWGFAAKWGVLKNELAGGYAVTALVGAMALLLTFRSYYDSSLNYIFLLLTMAAGLYMMQAGWFYTQYPFMALALVAAISVGARLLSTCERITDTSARLLILAVLCGFLGAGLVMDFAVPIVWRAGWDIKYMAEHGHPIANIDMQNQAAVDLEPHLSSHPRFMLFTNNLRAVNLLRPGTPIVNVGRFDYLWPIAGIKALEAMPREQAIFEKMAGYLTGSIAEDLDVHKPDMVINDISPFQYGLPTRYNIVGWLKRDPAFVQAWQHYKLTDRFDRCSAYEPDNCAYEIYYRK